MGDYGAPRHKRTVFLASVQLWLGCGRNANYGKRDAKGGTLMDEAALSLKVQERLSDAARKGWAYGGLQPKSILSMLSAIYPLYTKQRALNGYEDDKSDPVKDACVTRKISHDGLTRHVPVTAGNQEHGLCTYHCAYCQ